MIPHPRSDLPRIPELEGEFEVLRELGTGASSRVLLARTRSSGRNVALKLLSPRLHGDADAAARLFREARMLRQLDHPSILRLLDTRRIGRTGLALVLEYVRGSTLQDRIRSGGALPTREAARIFRGLAGALAYLERRHIVHRDVKPGNVHLDDVEGRVVLADFGIARHWDADAGLDPAEGTHGTPAYMSPEQIAGRPLDGRSDLYSLGLVGLEMLAGGLPRGRKLPGALTAPSAQPLPPAARLRPGLPPGLARAIDGCLASAPDRRWSGASEVLGVLEDATPLTAEERGTIPDHGPLPRPSRGSRLPAGSGSGPGNPTWEEAPTVRYVPGMSPPPPDGGD
jgi:eukaryotic-like serine/threonine-protein kinase